MVKDAQHMAKVYGKFSDPYTSIQREWEKFKCTFGKKLKSIFSKIENVDKNTILEF